MVEGHLSPEEFFPIFPSYTIHKKFKIEVLTVGGASSASVDGIAISNVVLNRNATVVGGGWLKATAVGTLHTVALV